MNKIYPKKTDFVKICQSEAKFYKNLRKIKLADEMVKEPEMLEIGSIKLVKINPRKLENFSDVDLSVEGVDLSGLESAILAKRTIKDILSTEISTPICELFNFEITTQMQNTLESIAAMISVNKN